MLLVAGGTGGHIFPALALGEELRNCGVTVIWVGRKGMLEETVARRAAFQFEPIQSGQVTGKDPVFRLRGLAEISAGFFQSVKIINRINPNAVIAAGGFVSAPLLMASWIRRIKFFLLEQNCVPGRVTRFFSRYAQEVFLTFPLEKSLSGNCNVTGTPLRQGIVQRCSQSSVFQLREEASATIQNRTVLVIGGSQGARVLNLAALDLAATLSNIRVVIITGKRDYELIKSLVHSRNCELVDWTDQPEEYYAQAALAITRAGALVTSELMAFGIPMIVVPFPFAADRHQDANARYIAKIGAGIVLEQSQLSGLTSLVQHLLTDSAKMEAMSRNARMAARIDAGPAIARRIITALNSEGDELLCLAD